MKLTPLEDRVVIKRIESSGETKTPSGIILTGEQEESIPEGKVISVGPDVVTLKEGDHVVFGAYSGHEMTFNGEKLIVMKKTDVVAIINES